MKITVVGCGSAFNRTLGQSSYLIESITGKKMLIDCGSYVPPMQLPKFGIDKHNYADEIDAIYISHQHGDHASGIEEIAFCTFFNPKVKNKIKMFAEKNLMRKLWDENWRGGLGSIEGKVMHLTDYFDCRPVEVNDGFYWEGIKFQTVQTIHVMNGFEIVPSFGLMMYEGYKEEEWNSAYDDKKVFITTDTQFCPYQINKFYEQCGLIIHDCETAPYYSKVHSHYDDLKILGCRSKMWLTHLNDNPKQDPVKDGFLGFLTPKQEVEI